MDKTEIKIIEKFITDNFGSEFDGVFIEEVKEGTKVTFRCNPQPSNFKEFFSVIMDGNSEENAEKFMRTVKEAAEYKRRMQYEGD